MRSRTLETRIYIAANTSSPCAEAPGYVTLQVGSALATSRFGMEHDDVGANISRLNANFCELTGLYWIWKNDNSHIVGLNHYRRYFEPRLHDGVLFKGHKVAQSIDFQELSDGADIIVPPPMQWHSHERIPISLNDAYGAVHVSHDIFVVRREVLRLFPEYKDAYDFVMNSHLCSQHNMFVAKKTIMDNYCEWLFTVLFTLEPLIPYEFYDRYQARVFGFISERLFNVWLCMHRGQLKVAYRGLVRTEDNMF